MEAYRGSDLALYLDWDEEELVCTAVLRVQLDQGIPNSRRQTHQMDQVIEEFPKVFSDIPRKARGLQYRIVTNPGLVIHAPSHPTHLAQQDIIES